MTRPPARAGELLVIVPSRGRPASIPDLAAALAATSTTRPHLLVAADDDDPALPGYQALTVWTDTDPDHAGPDVPFTAELTVGPRTRLGPTLNAVATDRASEHTAIAFLGDDHRPRTPGWDARCLETLANLPSGCGMVYGDDQFQGAAKPTAIVISSAIIRTLGWMVPPGLIHLYIDDAWLTLGTAIGRIRYAPDITIEHLTPFASKSQWDAGYAEVNSPEQYAADRYAYTGWITSPSGLPAAVALLRDAGLAAIPAERA
jgi:hypothetical protein